MGRGKNKQKQQQQQTIHIEELEIKNKVEIDYDKLAEAIVKAKIIEKEAQEREKAAVLAKWRAEVGYNEHENKKGFLKNSFVLAIGLKLFGTLCSFRRKSI